MRRLATMFVLAAVGGFAGASLSERDAQPATARCHITGHGNRIRPDDRCTPGTFDTLTRAQACAHKQRPSLPAAEKRRIVRQYGYGSWSGRDGELDHRVPFFLGGRTEEDNLWPQVGARPNVKDRMEFAVYDRVCGRQSMTVQQARRVFVGDWTQTYSRYVGQ